MEFKGATATLPANPAKGDMYKVAGETIDITIDGVAAKTGDSIVYNGEEWFLIPSGDDIEDTWRPVTGVDNDATLTFAAGEKLAVAVATTGTVTYSHEIVADPELLAENEQTRTYITEVVTDGYGHITGYKTATENIDDTNTTYEFECAAEHSNVYFTVKEMNGEEIVNTHTVCVDAYNKNEVDAKVKALNLEIYDNETVQETSRIDTAVANAAEALRIAGEANTAATDAKTGAAASAKEAADSALEALGSQNEAASSAQAASDSAAAALASQNAASASASAATESATTASQAKTDAEAAQALASGYAESADAAADEAVGAKNAAETAQGAAESARDEAAGSASAAAASASNAATSETNAKTSETAAASSASAAAASASEAASAQAAAEAAQAAAEDSNTSATAIANEAKTTADKAIQDVSNVANNGLILSKSADNKVSVDWDSNVVFVFNGGSASTLVD